MNGFSSTNCCLNSHLVKVKVNLPLCMCVYVCKPFYSFQCCHVVRMSGGGFILYFNWKEKLSALYPNLTYLTPWNGIQGSVSDVFALMKKKYGWELLYGSAASQWQCWRSCKNKEAMMKFNCSQTDFIITLAVLHWGALGFFCLHAYVR